MHPSTIHDERYRGAIVNMSDVHWIGIVKHDDSFWYVDRMETQRKLKTGYMETLWHKHPLTFVVVSSDYVLPERQ